MRVMGLRFKYGSCFVPWVAHTNKKGVRCTSHQASCKYRWMNYGFYVEIPLEILDRPLYEAFAPDLRVMMLVSADFEYYNLNSDYLM